MNPEIGRMMPIDACDYCGAQLTAGHSCLPVNLKEEIKKWRERCQCFEDLLSLEKEKMGRGLDVLKYLHRGLKANPALAHGGWVEQIEIFLKSVKEFEVEPTRPVGWICKKCRTILNLETKQCPECKSK